MAETNWLLPSSSLFRLNYVILTIISSCIYLLFLIYFYKFNIIPAHISLYQISIKHLRFLPMTWVKRCSLFVCLAGALQAGFLQTYFPCFKLKLYKETHISIETICHAPTNLSKCLLPSGVLSCVWGKKDETVAPERNITLTPLVDGFVHTQAAACVIRDALKL